MDKHPNEYLNEMVAFHVLQYLKKAGLKETGSKINQASWSFLRKTGINPDCDPHDLEGYDLGIQAALVQKRLVESGETNTSLRSIIRSNPYLKPLVAHGPQAWLIQSYGTTLRNIFELDMGTKQYGPNKDVYRNIVDNVKAARLMFESASREIAERVYKHYSHLSNLALVEGGAGNGAAMLTNLEKFSSLWPKFLVSDIDLKTKITAEELFQSKGFTGKLPWIKVDLGDVSDLLKVERITRGYLVLFSVNFIIHEHESIIENFFRAMSHSLPDAKLAITEFFLPEEQELLGPNFPWWFVYLHEISGQCLRTEKDFFDVAQKYGYSIFDRIDHQYVNKKPLISTLFLSK